MAGLPRSPRRARAVPRPLNAVRAAAKPWQAMLVPLAATLTVQVSVNLALLSVAVLAPSIARDLAVPTAWAGHFVALAYLAGALVSAGSDRVLECVGPMTGSLLAQALTALGLGLASVGNVGSLAAAALLVGTAYGLTTPTSAEILAAAAPPRLYGRVFSIKQTAVPGAGFLAGLVAPALAAGLGWQGALSTMAAIVALAGLVLVPWRRRLDAARLGRPPRAGSPLALVRADPRLLRLCLAGFALAGMQLCVSAYFTAFLVVEVGLSLAIAGALFALLQATGVPARIVWGWLADRVFGLRRALTMLATLATVGLLALALVDPDWSLAAIAVLGVYLGLGLMAWTGLLIAAAAQVDPGRASSLTAGAMLFSFMGIVCVPPLFGLIVGLLGSYAPAFAMTAGLGLVAMVLLATVNRVEASRGHA